MNRGTWLDRTIGWFSPELGARRLAYRRVIQLGYEGARGGRRTDGWLTGSGSADAESGLVYQTLRNRARDLVRNNPHAARALDVKVANTIGTGIMAEVPKGKIRDSWDAFVENCDADGNLDLYGIQSLIERCRSESGEVLIRFVATELRGASRVGFALRVLEPDFVDEARDSLVLANGNLVRRGIEYDQRGSVLAYYLFREHPGEILRGAANRVSDRVPADQVIHLFRRLRPGQHRGVTDFAPVMLRLRDLDDYDDAEVMRKKVEAAFSVFVTTPAGSAAGNIGPITTDSTGQIEGIYPAMVGYLRPGEGVQFADPKASSGYADFKRFAARDIAAGYGVPYELMTGDLSQVNYSSYRAGLVDFRRRVEQDQWQLHVKVVCEGIRGWFLRELGYALDRDAGARTAWEWTPPRFELIDPQKEAEAEIAQLRAGTEPLDEVVRRHGYTFAKHLDRLETIRDELDRRGLILTSDARVAAAGGAPQTNPAQDQQDQEGQDAQAA